ncbi:MAG TPA: FAD:protein FMN transferase, partial [Dissulfurispiraceae bacterium]
MDRTIRIKALHLIFSILCLLAFASCQDKESVFKKSKLAMDTIVSATVVSNSAKDAEASIDSAFAEIERLGKLMNFFSSDSELTLLNNSAGIKPVRVSKETFEVIEKAVYVSEKTG